MTPLAQALLNDWCRPKAKRVVADLAASSSFLLEAKCFDISALDGFFTANDIRATVGDLLASGRVFLPAPVTWLELSRDLGVLCVDQEWVESKNAGDGTSFFFAVASRECISIPEYIDVGGDSSEFVMRFQSEPGDRLPSLEAVSSNIIGKLFLINTPHIVGQKTHTPHAGLQRKIARAMGMVGKYPLHAYTEITLWCDEDDRREAASDEAIEARFSGRKCLHFVRSFLRWRRGELERVKAHWRGDPALGMKRSRYIAKPARPPSEAAFS
ncbi:hypothetical protein [Afifella sp. IM 167]|uniref:hypothetical protein n=1 Tax=Afifella sp. IM 167 TaxID=2033586 RepID=UPI001CC928CE|nr:hypothetical protein [Afifella sp. IM 167]MBZ8133236.1 hypothetical protein [Afifella sp. IM 167]